MNTLERQYNWEDCPRTQQPLVPGDHFVKLLFWDPCQLPIGPKPPQVLSKHRRLP